MHNFSDTFCRWDKYAFIVSTYFYFSSGIYVLHLIFPKFTEMKYDNFICSTIIHNTKVFQRANKIDKSSRRKIYR